MIPEAIAVAADVAENADTQVLFRPEVTWNIVRIYLYVWENFFIYFRRSHHYTTPAPLRQSVFKFSSSVKVGFLSTKLTIASCPPMSSWLYVPAIIAEHLSA